MQVEDSDVGLVQRAREGDDAAFARLADEHAGRVRSILLRLTGDPDRADDLAQETFLRAYRGLGRFRGDASFGTWVVQIALHAARDELRRKRRDRAVVSLDELREQRDGAGDPRSVQAWSDPSDAVTDNELHDRLEQALEKLPPPYREVFVLHHQHELSYSELATITGDSVGSLKVRAHRARQLLKDLVFTDVSLSPPSRARPDIRIAPRSSQEDPS